MQKQGDVTGHKHREDEYEDDSDDTTFGEEGDLHNLKRQHIFDADLEPEAVPVTPQLLPIEGAAGYVLATIVCLVDKVSLFDLPANLICFFAHILSVALQLFTCRWSPSFQDARTCLQHSSSRKS